RRTHSWSAVYFVVLIDAPWSLSYQDSARRAERQPAREKTVTGKWCQTPFFGRFLPGRGGHFEKRCLTPFSLRPRHHFPGEPPYHGRHAAAAQGSIMSRT